MMGIDGKRHNISWPTIDPVLLVSSVYVVTKINTVNAVVYIITVCTLPTALLQAVS